MLWAVETDALWYGNGREGIHPLKDIETGSNASSSGHQNAHNRVRFARQCGQPTRPAMFIVFLPGILLFLVGKPKANPSSSLSTI